MENTFVNITETPINLQKVVDFVQDNRFGAMDLFLGRIRNNNLGKDVVGVSYDVFDPLAYELFKTLCDEARSIYDQNIKCYIEHFKGYLNVGEISVVIAVGTPHRQEAFDACRFLIEELKHRAPIWKKEYYHDGETEWVQGHALCSHRHTKELKESKQCR